MIRRHYLDTTFRKSQKAYLHDYLKEEVFYEGLTRNVPGFSRFFEAMAYSHGEFGKALEHFAFMELRAHSSYSDLDYPVHFWRTKSGLEVDFILGDGEVAIEVKGSPRVHRRDLRSLETFTAAYAPRSAIVVSMEERERRYGDIRIVPVSKFLQELWSGQII